MLKAHLAAIKCHIPAKALERGIIMPRDQEQTGQYPKIEDFLFQNPFPRSKATAVKKKKGDPKAKKKKVAEVQEKVQL